MYSRKIKSNLRVVNFDAQVFDNNNFYISFRLAAGFNSPKLPYGIIKGPGYAPRIEDTTNV